MNDDTINTLLNDAVITPITSKCRGEFSNAVSDPIKQIENCINDVLTHFVDAANTHENRVAITQACCLAMHNEINEYALNVKDDYLVVCDDTNNPPSTIYDGAMPKVDVWFGLNGQRHCYSPTREDVQQYASSVPGYVPTNLTDASISNNLRIGDEYIFVEATAHNTFKLPDTNTFVFQQGSTKVGKLSWDADNGLQFEGQLHASAEQFVAELKRLWNKT